MKKLCLIIVIFFQLIACKEPIWNTPPTDGDTPNPIKNVNVKNLKGKSIIHFLIEDTNTLYVEASYTLSNGVQKNVKASKFIDSLIVDGFSSSKEYEINLYAVGINEQKSAPTKIKINPLTPVYINTFSSITASTTFGGVTIRGLNPERDALVIETLIKNSDGTWESLDRYYTSTDTIKYNVRGLEDKELDLAIFVRDRWLNYSDTLYTKITPLKEIQIPAADIREIPASELPSSATPWSNSYLAKKAVDGIIGLTVNQNYYMTARGTGMPQHFNVDLKKTYQLSRVLYYMRPTYFFRSISPSKVVVWGTENPSPDGSFEGWTMLGRFDVIKPSGLPLETNSDEDNALASAGINFEFDSATIPIRYLRIQTLETFGFSDYVTATEYVMFGNTTN